MKISIHQFVLKFLLLFCGSSFLLLTSCEKNDEDPQMDDPTETGTKKEYILYSPSTSMSVGDVTFWEMDDNSTNVVITLTGADPSASHPTHIHSNTAAMGGGIVISLENVDGTSGKSETIVALMDDGTPITYLELIAFNGYVNVHMSASDLGTLVAQGDIGQNELTDNREEYTLSAVASSGISGKVSFTERVSGEILAVISLENTGMGAEHPAHIHAGSVASGGGIAINLNAVNGDNGMSKTDISKFNNDTPISYDELIEYAGHVKVHLNATELGTVLSAGDVGGNRLTSNQMIYNLDELNTSGISGSITFAERESGFALAIIRLDGTENDGNHPAHIHANDIAMGGGIVIDLENVDGATGMSQTHIDKNNADEGVTYADLLNFNGHVKVHLSSDNLGTVISGGDIGSNSDSGARVSYANDIRPILDSNCQVSPCHGTDSGLPSWATYDNVKARASGIKSKTAAKEMPPALSGRSLSDLQIQLIANWVDDGAENN